MTVEQVTRAGRHGCDRAWVRRLIPSSPVLQGRAARTGLQDAAKGQGQLNGLGCAVMEEASRAFRRANRLFHCGKHNRLTSTGLIHQANHPLDEIIHKTEATGLTSIAMELVLPL
jgi:hypothetical protein